MADDRLLEEIAELKDELRVGKFLTAKLTDQCRELEDQLSRAKAERLDRPELMEELKEIVLEIRQYLCNTEFAPEPFGGPVDLDKLTIDFPEKIRALFPDVDKVKELALKAIADEPEFPGDMPDELWVEIQGDRAITTRVMQNTARITRRDITDRFLEALKSREEVTIKEVRQRLCTRCANFPRQMRTFPAGVDDEGYIIYRRRARKCNLRPITESGKDCPYFKEMPK